MGFRFSKRISILPGVRLNLSGSGASLSVGPRGASITMGKRGVYGNVGIPGTGLSYRERLDKPSRRSTSSRPPEAPTPPEPQIPNGLVARIIDDQLVFLDGEGQSIDPALIPLIKRTMKDELREFLQENVEARNDAATSLATIHLDIPQTVGQILRSSAGKPSREQFASGEDHMAALMAWRAAQANAGPDLAAVEDALLQRLGSLEWPRETNIAISFNGGRLLLDVDLPEIEDMPSVKWSADFTQLAFRPKELTQKERAALYLDHVCSLLVRLVGHSMAVAEHIHKVAVSAYTQRSGAVGQERDEYVATLSVDRSAWGEVNLASLAQIEPQNLLRHLGAKIETNSRGILLVQTPLT
ncbi:DUF4236 domain-containing protein [Sphingomonas sp. IC081]|uniref:DUF4236 domain-containing protein n=1 Tax=Sphingomonas sp. IC081 TaxID=304378 RepID=UPI00115BD5F3|nr:DUF4236 domain-containing protein [Sphingomonas sp. IC081]QDK35785.1 hypothetical protein DM450_23960 [Sphingomonas sp. IC081]